MKRVRLTLLQRSRDWAELGACVGEDAEVFYPQRGGDWRTPKAICADCPVKSECLEWALYMPENVGVWGGTSENERRRMRRELGIVAPRPVSPDRWAA